MQKPHATRASPPSTSRLLAKSLALALLLTGLALALAQGNDGPDPAMEAPGDAIGVSTGVFTEAQAERGAEVFLANCAGCHGAALEGGFGPQLAPIGEHWHDTSLGSLFGFVSSAMPFSAPGSLEPQQYADVIAFVLRSNGFAAGEAELPADREALDGVIIDAAALTGQ